MQCYGHCCVSSNLAQVSLSVLHIIYVRIALLTSNLKDISKHAYLLFHRSKPALRKRASAQASKKNFFPVIFYSNALGLAVSC